LKVNRRLEGTLPPTSALVSRLVYSLTMKMDATYAPPKRQSIFNGLYGIISQKTNLFKELLDYIFSITKPKRIPEISLPTMD
jgi:hypothetical protein